MAPKPRRQECLLEITKQKVDQSAAQKQREHGLAQHVQRGTYGSAPLMARKLVVPLDPKPGRRFGFL
ncbi:hypothetical protein AB7M56_000634 [Bradyrhizobium elkanii]|nr:hypothetical protein [Bradyrhizobium elkanii]MCS3522737.1 hypothetical protein [Bradyrhizobium elkanii]MCS4070390.1 hypothetical protein [Bradyrhizobium elkanii]MCS4077022.1 hypothetical protein [Bradyrhizobium elkanii]MCS4111926.1 hypothetical protein [Bradyrhizobium elkanii]